VSIPPYAADPSPYAKCYKVMNLTKEEAVLIEPAACAVHGMDKLQMPFGAKVLLIGAGPTGLILAQLMKVPFSSPVWHLLMR
jgi:D-arabinitol dehydrogenase (NADP+)